MDELEAMAIFLAGFALGHAGWTISGPDEGELLVPFAFVDRGGDLQLGTFTAETQEEAIAEGKSAVAELAESDDAVDGWAFVREGTARLAREHASGVTIDLDGQDVLAVDFWMRGMERPATLVQSIARGTAAGGFRLLGAPTLVIGGAAADDDEVADMLPHLHAGIHAHEGAAPLWPTWQ